MKLFQIGIQTFQQDPPLILYEHTLNIVESIPVGSRDCAAFDRTLHYINFNRFDNRTTPTLSKERLYFYLYKGSVFEHEIHIEYFHLKQEVDNVHFVSLDKNGVPLVGASSSFNYYTLVFMLKDDMDCSLPSNSTHIHSHPFVVTIDSTNRLDRKHFFSQRISDWAIDGIFSCTEAAFYLATAGTSQILQVKYSEMNSFNKDINIFWWKGIREINCELHVCEKYLLSHVPLDLQLSRGRKTIEAVTVNLTQVSLYFILRNYKIFNDAQVAQRAKYINDTKVLDEDETLFQSWNSASLTCSNIGGYLTVFTSRKELEEFITVIKTGRLPLLEALYIGLTFNVSSFQWITGDPIAFQAWLDKNCEIESTHVPQIYFYSRPGVIPLIRSVQTLSIFQNQKPQMNLKNTCTPMYLANLAYPEWITIDCDKKYYIDIVCMKKDIVIFKNNITYSPSENQCLKNGVIKGLFCFYFVYYNGKNKRIPTNGSYLSSNSIKDIYFIILAVKYFPKFLFPEKDKMKVLYYSRYFNTIKVFTTYEAAKKSVGYLVTKINEVKNVNVTTSGNVYLCNSGKYISNFYVCDGIFDCDNLDKSDEEGCTCIDHRLAQSSKCRYISIKAKPLQCSPSYSNHNKNCFSFSDYVTPGKEFVKTKISYSCNY